MSSPREKGATPSFDHSMRIPQAISRRFPHAEPRPGRAGRLPGRRGTRYLIPHRHDRARPPSPSYPDRDRRPQTATTVYLPMRMIHIRRSKHRRLATGQEVLLWKSCSGRPLFFRKITQSTDPYDRPAYTGPSLPTNFLTGSLR